MTIAESGSFATLANIATVIGTVLAVWAGVSRLMRNLRVKRGIAWLSRAESQGVALGVAAFAGCLVLVVLLAATNHSLGVTNNELVQKDITLAQQFGQGERAVATEGANIAAQLKVCLAPRP